MCVYNSVCVCVFAHISILYVYMHAYISLYVHYIFLLLKATVTIISMVCNKTTKLVNSNLDVVTKTRRIPRTVFQKLTAQTKKSFHFTLKFFLQFLSYFLLSFCFFKSTFGTFFNRSHLLYRYQTLKHFVYFLLCASSKVKNLLRYEAAFKQHDNGLQTAAHLKAR